MRPDRVVRANADRNPKLTLYREVHMKKVVSSAMIVVGVGLLVLGFSDYVPAGSGDFGGWSDSCRYVMTVGAMLTVAGLRLP